MKLDSEILIGENVNRSAQHWRWIVFPLEGPSKEWSPGWGQGDERFCQSLHSGAHPSRAVFTLILDDFKLKLFIERGRPC